MAIGEADIAFLCQPRSRLHPASLLSDCEDSHVNPVKLSAEKMCRGNLLAMWKRNSVTRKCPIISAQRTGFPWFSTTKRRPSNCNTGLWKHQILTQPWNDYWLTFLFPFWDTQYVLPYFSSDQLQPTRSWLGVSAQQASWTSHQIHGRDNKLCKRDDCVLIRDGLRKALSAASSILRLNLMSRAQLLTLHAETRCTCKTRTHSCSDVRLIKTLLSILGAGLTWAASSATGEDACMH